VLPLIGQILLVIPFETCLLLHAPPSAMSGIHKHKYTSIYVHVKTTTLNFQVNA
jgi:hypothetical protein